MTTYCVGIDTGGTYTDAVIVDVAQHRVIATAKALTSRGDLSIGVMQALSTVLDTAGESVDSALISYVSLSTTLATNALVEGHGDQVLTFLVGFDEGMAERTQIAEAAPSTRIVRIDGGHTHAGEEATPLDVAAVKAVLAEKASQVRAYAVAAHYSVRNSSHELQMKTLIEATTGRPATLSSDLSAALDAPRRALTATLNARIISLITQLESAVQTSLHRLGISAPIMIVKGDGSLAPSDTVVLKPIETILSGPAASVIGARFLSGLADFVIADIGGTTSDVATVRNGWPKLEENGSEVGGFRTLVRAIDVQTIGLGGDSEVLLDTHGQVSLAHHRVVPISLLAHKWPQVLAQLDLALAASSGMAGALRYGLLPEGAQDIVTPENLSDKDRIFLSHFSGGNPVLLRDVAYGSTLNARVRRLVGRGLLQISGFTPSDAAHVLGLQSQWSSPAALAACELVGRASGRVKGRETSQQLQALAQDVHSELARKSSWLLLEQLAGQKFGSGDTLVSSLASGTANQQNLGIGVQPLLPIVAVGGPAAVFFPEVGRRLNTRAMIPEHSQVANAIGAAVAMIKVRLVLEITSNKSGYTIQHRDKPEFVAGGQAAIERAKVIASTEVKSRAKLLGGHDVDIKLTVARIDLPDMDESVSLIGATITAEAISEPTPSQT